jgi:hypothetical protein
MMGLEFEMKDNPFGTGTASLAIAGFTRDHYL